MSAGVKPTGLVGAAKKKSSSAHLRQSKSKLETYPEDDIVTEEELLTQPYITPDDVMKLSGMTQGKP